MNQKTLKERFLYFIKDKSALNRLILINSVIYLIFLVLKLILNLFGFLLNLDYNLSETIIVLMSCPASVTSLLYHPWAIITSMFFHATFWHIFFNMFMLYVVGKIFLQYLTNRQLWITYIAGGLCGNIAYMAAYNVFPIFLDVLPNAIAMGASGAIMAIMFAIAAFRPNHQVNLLFFGRISLKWLALIFIIIDLLSISGGNAGGHISHLGGALYGAAAALYLLYRKPNASKPKKKKTKFYTSNQGQGRPVSDEDFNAQKAKNEKKLDAILDKIAQNGYSSLSKEEKDFLYFYRK